jgi:hypothetical protein
MKAVGPYGMAMAAMLCVFLAVALWLSFQVIPALQAHSDAISYYVAHCRQVWG